MLSRLVVALFALAMLPGCAHRLAPVAQPPLLLPSPEDDSPIRALIAGLSAQIDPHDTIAVAMPLGSRGEFSRFSQDLQSRLLIELERARPQARLQAWEPIPDDKRLDNQALDGLRRTREARIVLLTVYEPAGDHLRLTSYLLADAGQKAGEATVDFRGPSRSLVTLPPLGEDR